MAEFHLVEWIDNKAACERLQVSKRTLDRLCETGQIATKLERRAGRKPERMYLASAVERHAFEAEAMRENRLQHRAVVPVRPPDAAVALPPKLLEAPAPAVAITQKLWLSLEEAQAYSGLARNDLLALCRDGKLTARKSGGWRIRRASLEGFEG